MRAFKKPPNWQIVNYRSREAIKQDSHLGRDTTQANNAQSTSSSLRKGSFCGEHLILTTTKCKDSNNTSEN